MVPDVSVALCVYNGERHLAEQLDSLLAQREVAFEIVAIDDGSSDASLDLLHAYARRDPRLRVVAGGANRGHAARVVEAFALCRAPWIAPSDQDDVWDPFKLRRLLDRALEAGVDAAYCDSMLCDAAGQPTGRSVGAILGRRQGRTPMDLVFQNTVSGHALLFRRPLLDTALPLPAGMFYDHWLAICAMAGAGLVHEPTALVHFRRHDRAQTCAGRQGRRPEGGRWFDATLGCLHGVARLGHAAANDAGDLATAIADFRAGGSGWTIVHTLWPYRESLPRKSGLPAIDLIRFAHRLYRMRRRERRERHRALAAPSEPAPGHQ